MIQEDDRISWVAVPTTTGTSKKDEVSSTKNTPTEDITMIMIAGYIDWKPSCKERDLLYIHPSYFRQGIASRLYQQVLQEALKKPAVSNDATITSTSKLMIQTFSSEGAKPFFEKQNLSTVGAQRFCDWTQ
ncbi:unnamed protein product [Cylindrotheca closterium]|uniref:N-acetyltransferase domain-containing protein n=1 Tax=Cylindrotheca closterium TaxID=2856 RepID=A0AAD2JK33_9STRA|nr:unnamed protein product [Cylindrotheca closterium]